MSTKRPVVVSLDEYQGRGDAQVGELLGDVLVHALLLVNTAGTDPNHLFDANGLLEAIADRLGSSLAYAGPTLTSGGLLTAFYNELPEAARDLVRQLVTVIAEATAPEGAAS